MVGDMLMFAPIGMQNLYVINTAISKSRFRAYQVALITVFFHIWGMPGFIFLVYRLDYSGIGF